jgi:hypothetical protein
MSAFVLHVPFMGLAASHSHPPWPKLEALEAETLHFTRRCVRGNAA